MLVTNLNKVRRLPREERRRLFQSALLLPLIHLALLSTGYYRLRAWMEKLMPLEQPSFSPPEAEVLQRAREVARIVAIAAEHGIYKATCLRRSLLLWWFLRKEDIQSDVRFGVRMQDGKLEAHAWVERHGIVVNDTAAVHENYQALDDALPSTRLGL